MKKLITLYPSLPEPGLVWNGEAWEVNPKLGEEIMINKGKEFEIKDVLTTYTGIVLVDGGIDGVYLVLNFLTGANLFTHQLPRASEEMKPALKSQVYFLGTEDFQSDLDQLLLSLETPSGKEYPGHTCLQWLSEQKMKHGEKITLYPAHNDYTKQNPTIELVRMMK